jgi:parallel beta-helix repeat protein
MKKREILSRIFGIALVFVMIGATIGGLTEVASSVEPANGAEMVSPSSEWTTISGVEKSPPVDANKVAGDSLQVSEPTGEGVSQRMIGVSSCENSSTPLADADTQTFLRQISETPQGWESKSLAVEDLCSQVPCFWDTPLQSPTVSIIGQGNESELSVLPGPRDRVRVIMQFEQQPVVTYISQVCTAANEMQEQTATLVNGYQYQLRESHGSAMVDMEQVGIAFEMDREYTYIFNGIAGSVDMEHMKEIADIPTIKTVYPDYLVRTSLTDSVPLIGAPQVWAVQDAGGQSVTGQGIEVAIIDTGIDYSRADLGAGFGLGYKVTGGYDFVNDDADPMDDMGHGTHVAGIVAANGTLKGVAPDATLRAYKVLNENGSGWMSDVISGIEAACNPDGNPSTDDAVDVINLSLGGSGDPDDPVCQAVDAAVDQGVVVCVAAGNAGGYGTVGSPGVARKALTVGASDKEDSIASFSSRGPVTGSWAIKPDIVGPGVDIYSTVPESGELGDPSGYRGLSGTSMSTPHLAGAAALVKQLHPSWTPEMIKANLMNTSNDIGYDVFTQGTGRVEVYQAANAQAVVTPGSLSLGLDDISKPSWSASASFVITNQANSTLTYSLTVSDGLPPGISTSLNTSNVTLDPGEARAVLFELSVDNTVVPNPSDPPYSYEGEIVAQCGTETLRVPFAFIKAPVLNITFDEEPWTVLIHNRVDRAWFFSYPGTSLSVPLPQGTYDIIVTYPDVTTRVFREGVVVDTATNLEISKADAIYEVTIVPIDKDGQPIYINNGGEQITHKASDIWQLFLGGFPTSRHFSAISNEYSWEWVTSTGSRNNVTVYDFNGYANEGVYADMTFQNEPSDFKHVTYHYSMPPAVNEAFLLHWLSQGPSGGWSFTSYSSYDEPLLSPFTREAYHMPMPYPGFSLGYTFEEVYEYEGAPFDNWAEELLLLTPYLAAKDTQTIEGYLLWEPEVPVFSTNSSQMPIGLAPPHWFGRFENDSSEIRLRAARGGVVRLFTNQRQDMTPHPDLPYELYQDDTLVGSGNLSGAGQPWSSPWYIGIPISPGAYVLKVPYTEYYVKDQQGNALMTATFDTQADDKNPPFLTSLNVLCDGELADLLLPQGTNEVEFAVEDDIGLSNVFLFYSTDGINWNGLSLSNIGNEYTAEIPSLPNGTMVSLRIIAEDLAGNSLTYTADPAFAVEVTPPILVAPQDGSATELGEVLFQWNAVPTAATYRIQIDVVDTFDSPYLVSEAVASTNYTAALNLGSYYWHVLAIDGEGNESDYSPTWHFSVAKPVVQLTTDPDWDGQPAITQTDDGTVWVVWGSDRAGRNGIWYKTSIDGGETWSADSSIDLGGIWGYSPAIAQTSDSKIWVTFWSYESGNPDIWYTASSDGGASWSAPSQITTDPESDYYPAITQTSDGTIWVVWHSDQSGNADIWYKTSVDGAENWSDDYQLTTDPDWDGQPAITQTDDGTVWVVWGSDRAGGNGIWYKTSPDGGETWSADSSIDLGGMWGYDPAIAQTSDGKIWVVFCSWQSGNADIWYAASSDDGASWSEASQFTRFVGADWDAAAAALASGQAALVWVSNRFCNYDIWYGVIDIMEDMNPPPALYWAEHEPRGPDTTQMATIRAAVGDESGAEDVQLVWWVDGEPQDMLPMYDDGAHNDYSDGDGVYGIQIGPFPVVGTYVEYQIQITDIDNNAVLGPEYPYSFHVIEPFAKTADILLVADEPWGGSHYQYYGSALDDLACAYDVWDCYLRGNIGGDTLNQYVDGVVIWATPYWGYIEDTETWDNLSSYLDSGGQLFISGQDVGHHIGESRFYQDYLHAQYVQDNIGLYCLDGVPGDAITDGLYVCISGGDGANNQARSDEVDPIWPAQTIFTYDPEAITTLVEPGPPEDGTQYGGEEMLPGPDRAKRLQEKMPPQAPSPERGVGTEATVSSGSGALRVDTGIYKVVYLAFGFEAINSAGERATVMERVLSWLEQPNISHWSRVATPTVDDWVLAPSSTIIDYAVADGGGIAYAIVYCDAPDAYYLLKSSDGAATWETVTGIDALLEKSKKFAGKNITDMLQVACDAADPNYVWVALNLTDGSVVETCVLASRDGGSTFKNTNEITGLDNVVDLEVSPAVDSVREVAISGSNTTAGKILRYVGGNWEDTSDKDDYPGWISCQLVADIRFSPSWETDNTIVAVTANATSVYLQTGTWGETPVWKDKSIVTGKSIATQLGGATAGVTLPSDYSGTAASTRWLWVWVNFANNTEADYNNTGLIYYVKGDFKNLVGMQIEDKPWLTHVSYWGTRAEGKAIAGLYYPEGACGSNDNIQCMDVQVYRIDGIKNMDLCGTCEPWSRACKPPTGARAMAAFYVSADKVYAVALGPHAAYDEGAWSVSFDDGDTWNQLSLVDTHIDYLTDVAVSPDCNKMMLASVNLNHGCGCDSVWLHAVNYPESGYGDDDIGYDGHWLRTWCGQLRGSNDADFPDYPQRGLLRLAPEETTGDAVYLVDRMATTVYWNEMEGLACWSSDKDCGLPKISNIVDLAIKDKQTIYALSSDGKVSMADEYACSWDKPVDSLVCGWTIAVLGDAILVGGYDGQVSYSDDGGETFTELEGVAISGYVTVAFDTYFDQNHTIYAALAGAGTDNGIYRWVIGESTEWKNLSAEPYDYTGLVLDGPTRANPMTNADTGGVLYGSYVDGGITGVARCLTPAEDVCCGSTDWDYLTMGLTSELFEMTPQALKICACLTADSNTKLFTIDSSEPYDTEQGKSGTVWSFEDCYAKSSPATIYVPDNYPTIQAAVDAASPGDTIIVRNGTYTENVDLNKDHLTIQSQNGAESTIVQAANQDDHVFEVTSNHIAISGFTVEGASAYSKAGIYLQNADHCHISQNIASNSALGIYLYSSCDNDLGNNDASNDNIGIGLYYSSSGNALINNIVTSNNAMGIYLYSSGSNNLTNNTMSGNSHNFGIDGVALLDYIQNIDTNNEVDGRPVYYWISYHNRQIPSDAGYVGIIDCTNIVVEGLTLRNNHQGVLLAYSSNSRIENIEVLNNDWGIRLDSSDNNTLTKITASNNGYDLRLDSSSNNMIYLNNFHWRACSYNSENNWSSPEEITYIYTGNIYTGYLGNHWGCDYTGTDANGDGVGDTPHSMVVCDGVTDNYPLVEPFESYEIACIVGETREVNCSILPGVNVTLYQGPIEIGSSVSDVDGNYTLAVPALGNYNVTASKDGFRNRSQAISINETRTYTLDFVGNYGLIPNAPNMSYVLACINLWKFGTPPCNLNMSTVLAVINAWKFPI